MKMSVLGNAAHVTDYEQRIEIINRALELLETEMDGVSGDMVEEVMALKLGRWIQDNYPQTGERPIIQPRKSVEAARKSRGTRKTLAGQSPDSPGDP